MKSTDCAAFRRHEGIVHLPRMRLALIFLTAAYLCACGPDLNSPSAKSVSGKWQASDSVSYFYNLKLDLVQDTQGEVTGTWSSLLKGGNLSCPVGTVCAAANTASGRNTVVGVSIEVLGIGKFTGQLEDGNILRGDIFRFDGDYKIKFTKIP